MVCQVRVELLVGLAGSVVMFVMTLKICSYPSMARAGSGRSCCAETGATRSPARRLTVGVVNVVGVLGLRFNGKPSLSTSSLSLTNLDSTC